MTDVAERVRMIVQEYMAAYPNTRWALEENGSGAAYRTMLVSVSESYRRVYEPSPNEWNWGLNRQVTAEVVKCVAEIRRGA